MKAGTRDSQLDGNLFALRWCFVGMIACLAIGCLTGCSGLDKLPAGSQLQSSTFGLRFAPNSPDNSPLVIGSHSFIATTAQPADAGPNLNRFEGTAPMTSVKSTVASGPVGEQLQAAGGPEAIKYLTHPELRVQPLPRTDE